MSTPRFPHFDVVVKQALQLTPHVKRLVIDASAIRDCVRGLPAEWLKVVVPGLHGPDELVARAYTIRSFDRTSGDLALDFVLHGDDGAVSGWATRARVGDAFAITPPHPRSVYVVDDAPRAYLLFGDETALPAIATIVRALPRDASARVFLEVQDASEEQPLDSSADVSVRWVYRRGAARSPLAQTAADIFLPPSAAVAVWIAGEAEGVRAIRDHFRATGVPASHLHATGYWKRGASDFRDEAG